eukprot:gene31265-37780_t
MSRCSSCCGAVPGDGPLFVCRYCRAGYCGVCALWDEDKDMDPLLELILLTQPSWADVEMPDLAAVLDGSELARLLEGEDAALTALRAFRREGWDPANPSDARQRLFATLHPLLRPRYVCERSACRDRYDWAEGLVALYNLGKAVERWENAERQDAEGSDDDKDDDEG